MWGMISMGCSKCGVPQGMYHPEKSQAMSHRLKKYIYRYKVYIIPSHMISFLLGVLVWDEPTKKESVFGKHIDQHDQTVFFNMGMSSL